MLENGSIAKLVESVLALAKKNRADKVSTVKVLFNKPLICTPEEFQTKFYTMVQGTPAEAAELEWRVVDDGSEKESEKEITSSASGIELDEIVIENI